MTIRYAMAQTLAALMLAGVLALGGCAGKGAGQEEVVVMPGQETPGEPIDPKLIDKLIDVTEKSLVVQKNLEDVDLITVNVQYADLLVSAGHSRRDTALRIQKLRGGEHCRVRLAETDKELRITESETEAGGQAPENCRFGIEISMQNSANLDIRLKRGAVAVETWRKPISIRMDGGDVDVGSIGALSVDCGRCTLAGEGVSGALKFRIDTGNVGLAGLDASAEGSTLGDTILKWKKLLPGSRVDVSSRAGDIYLIFPRGARLETNLRAPRGDASSALKESVSGGVPVTAEASLGNVRVLSGGK